MRTAMYAEADPGGGGLATGASVREAWMDEQIYRVNPGRKCVIRGESR